MKVRVYGKVINRWFAEHEKWGKVLTQKEVEYKEYDAETGELTATGTEDFSPQRWSNEVEERWIYTWDGVKLNKGGHRWFEDHGTLTYRKSERNAAKALMAIKYENAEMIQFRK